MALLNLSGISKSYEDTLVLDRVSLSLEKENILCLLGPSGCGKTTLLRIIAGLERPDAGTVCFDGKDMSGIEPYRRPFGMMFQEFALFPHKNVFGNVAFGLRMQKLPRSEVVDRTREMLTLVGLGEYGARSVGDLSGGERQRVALARTLSPRPRLLLLDEPLGALDRALRERLMVDLRAILKGVSATCIFVTHDQAEAYAIADSIAVIMGGRIEQIDAPERLYRSPKNPEVARFLGLQNLVEGTVCPGGDITTEFGTLSMKSGSRAVTDRVTLLIQPDAACLKGQAPSCDRTSLTITGVVRNFLYRGRYYTLEIESSSGTRLMFDLPDDTPALPTGRYVHLAIDPEGISIMGDDSR